MTHCFKSGGLNIVLDVYSGSVHLVDEPTYDIIGMYETTEKDEIRKRILEKYGKTGEATAEEIDELEEAGALKDISHMPARVKCAVLGWRTLKEAIGGEEE